MLWLQRRVRLLLSTESNPIHSVYSWDFLALAKADGPIPSRVVSKPGSLPADALTAEGLWEAREGQDYLPSRADREKRPYVLPAALLFIHFSHHETSCANLGFDVRVNSD